MDRQIRQDREGVWDGKWTVHGVCRLTDAKGIRKLQIFIAQKRILRPKTRFESSRDIRRVNRNNGHLAISDLGGLMELDQFRQLKPSLGSPGTAIKGQDQRRAFGQFFD